MSKQTLQVVGLTAEQLKNNEVFNEAVKSMNISSSIYAARNGHKIDIKNTQKSIAGLCITDVIYSCDDKDDYEGHCGECGTVIYGRGKGPCCI